MTTDPGHRPRHTPARPGFTLLELMVSIALVLVLILGINEVFSLTSQTVGAGNALSDIHRTNRTGSAVVYQDLNAAVISDSPCLIIRSEQNYAYRNKADRDTDPFGNVAMIDPERTGGRTVPTFVANYRNHRMDRIAFFARDLFRRQTGTGNAYVDTVNVNGAPVPVSSNEAWIVYGHLKQPDVSGALNAYLLPGEGSAASNPFNFFATQWILGRNVILLHPNPQSLGTPPGNQQYFRDTSNTNLTPLSLGSSSSDGSTIQQSRYDLAQTSIDGYKAKIAGYTGSNNKGEYWGALIDYSFQGNPVPVKPLTSAGASQTVPCFMPGCTQFMVDFAGDFVTQDDTGKVIPSEDPITHVQNFFVPDGKTDFIVDTGNTRKIRWYGFPRDVNNDGAITMNDVIPLGVFAGATAPCERGGPLAGGPSYAAIPQKPSPIDLKRYTVAWGTDAATVNFPRPKMLRFTIAIDDPAGRVGDAQTFEYVGGVR